MQCPKCNSEFKAEKFENVQIDKCSNCKAIWFDIAEVNDLLKMPGSERIDLKKTNKEKNIIADISCPKCGVKMLKLSVIDQPHITYEQCPSCHGTFFDAGEFRDYKTKSILDLFKK